MEKCVKIGIFILALILPGCLEQDLELLTADEAIRLLSGSEGQKTWLSTPENLSLNLDSRLTTHTFIVHTINQEDSLAYGGWTISENLAGDFTDTLNLSFDSPNQTAISELLKVTILTSEILEWTQEESEFRFVHVSN